MSCFLQTTDGDLDFTNGRLTVVTDPVQAGSIKLFNRFRMFLGEWFRDTRIGMPYLTQILVKAPILPLVAQIFRNVIINTEPFTNATVTVTPPNAGTRMSNVSFTAKVDPKVTKGATVTATSLDVPFIVNTPGT